MDGKMVSPSSSGDGERILAGAGVSFDAEVGLVADMGVLAEFGFLVEVCLFAEIGFIPEAGFEIGVGCAVEGTRVKTLGRFWDESPFR